REKLGEEMVGDGVEYPVLPDARAGACLFAVVLLVPTYVVSDLLRLVAAQGSTTAPTAEHARQNVGVGVGSVWHPALTLRKYRLRLVEGVPVDDGFMVIGFDDPFRLGPATTTTALRHLTILDGVILTKAVSAASEVTRVGGVLQDD